MGADVERRSRAEEGGRWGRRTGSILVVAAVVTSIEVVLARTRDGRERVWRESTILCVFIASLSMRDSFTTTTVTEAPPLK